MITKLKGYKACTKEFNKVFREISMLGYGIVFLAHSEEKTLDEDSTDTFVRPALEKRAYAIINGLVDIIGYIDVDFNNGKRFLQLRSTPHCVAGSRFEYMPQRIELSYDNLVNALADAIEKEGRSKGGLIIDSRIEVVAPTRPFKDAMEEARQLWEKLTANENAENAKAISNLLKVTFGEPKKFSEIVETQQDLLELVISDMRDM